jgi:hypothetical protein
MAEEKTVPFAELLKSEIAELEDRLSRNPTYQRLQAARRTLEAYEPKRPGPKPKGGAA